MKKKNNSASRGVIASVVAFLIGASLASIPRASGQIDNDVTTEDAQTLRVTKVFDFGAFCVENIPVGAITSVGRPELHADGIWREVTIAVDGAQPSKPHIFFLSGVSRRAGVLSACGKNLPKDVSRILEGDLDHGTLTFQLLIHPVAGLAPAEQIESGGMDVVLTHVHLQFAPLYGGQVAAQTLKVANIGEFIANPQRLDNIDDDILKGVLEVGSQRLRILGAKIRLPGAPDTVSTNLSPGPDGSAILVEIPTGQVSLFSGTQSSPALTSTAVTKLAAAGITFDTQHWKLSHVVLTAYSGRKPPILSFRNLTLDASDVVHGAMPFVAASKPEKSISIGDATGALAQDSGEASSSSYTISTLQIPQADLKFGGDASAPAVTGKGSIRVREIDDVNLDADAEVRSPDLPGLNAITAIAGSSLTVHISGRKATPKINGGLDLTKATVGALTLQSLTRDKLTYASPEPATSEVGLAFVINSAPQSGHWQFDDPTGGRVTLEGELNALSAKGTVWFGAGQLPPRIAIDPGTLHFSALGSVVRDSIIFGAPPDHIQISPNLDISSPAGVVVARSSVSGSVDVGAGLLVIDTPQLSFDIQDQGRFRINAPVRFDTGATIALDLSSRAVTLIDGHAEVSNTSATAVDPSQSVTLSGIEVHAPSISLKHMSIAAIKGTATISLTGLQFQATALVHAADPNWSATNAATRIDQLDATLAQANNAVQLKDASLSVLSVSADRGAYTSHDGLSISGTQMAIKVATATRLSVTGADISIASGKLAVYVANAGATTSATASYDAFHVTASGTADDINGAIHLHVTGINGGYEFPALRNKCPNDLKLRLGVEIASFGLDGTIQHGDASGSAEVNHPKINLQKTGNDVCEWNESYDVSVPRVVLMTVCWIPVIGNAICNAVQKVVNVNVSVPVRWRAQAVALDVPVESDNVAISLAGKQGASVCVHGARVDLDAVRKLQTLTVTPTFEAHGDLANLVKKAWDLAFQVSEGLLTTSVVTSLTDLTSLITSLFPIDHCN